MLEKYSLKLLLAIRETGAARFRDLRAVVQNPRTLSAKLKALGSMGLVERAGSTYRLTERGRKVAEKLVEIAELIRPQPPIVGVERIPHAYYAPVVKKFCEKLLEVFGKRLVAVVLFGSIARGDWRRDSDIDLIIVADGWSNKRVWERIRELCMVEEMVEASVEYARAVEAGYVPRFQPYPLSPEEAARFNRIYLDVVLDGIILFDREGFANRVLSSFRKKLEKMGAKRVVLPNGSYYWVLKDVEPGEVLNLGWRIHKRLGQSSA